MAKNQYAVRLMAQKAALAQIERKEIVHRCLTTIFQASAIALNEQFGFGPDRISRFRDAMEATIEEYGGLISGTDVDYADEALDRRFKQVMRTEEYTL